MNNQLKNNQEIAVAGCNSKLHALAQAEGKADVS